MSSIRSEPIATSDTESLNEMDEEVLSPSDGFFNGQPVPDEMLVPDPRQRNTAADKEREAREEQQNLNAGASRLDDVAVQPSSRSPRHQTSTSPRSPRPPRNSSSAFNDDEDDHINEQTPLIFPDPPAYADIERNTNTANTPVRYNTMGSEQYLFRDRDPQDLGGASEPLLPRGSERKSRSWRTYLTDGNKLGKLLIIICVVLSIAGLLVGIVAKFAHEEVNTSSVKNWSFTKRNLENANNARRGAHTTAPKRVPPSGVQKQG